jgi:hypothetical protein
MARLLARPLPAALICGQCPGKISLGAGERIGKRLGVLCSLGDASADVRPSNEGCITNERNTTKWHACHFEIKDCGESRLTGASDQLSELRSQQCVSSQLKLGDDVFSDQRRQY